VREHCVSAVGHLAHDGGHLVHAPTHFSDHEPVGDDDGAVPLAGEVEFGPEAADAVVEHDIVFGERQVLLQLHLLPLLPLDVLLPVR